MKCNVKCKCKFQQAVQQHLFYFYFHLALEIVNKDPHQDTHPNCSSFKMSKAHALTIFFIFAY